MIDLQIINLARFFRYAGQESTTVTVGPQTYIVAQNPEVLAHLMRENENRIVNPSAYNTPVSVFNTIAVDFENQPEHETEEPVLKTLPIPVQTIQELNPLPPEDSPIPTENQTSLSPEPPKINSELKEPDYISKNVTDPTQLSDATIINDSAKLSDAAKFSDPALSDPAKFSDMTNYPEAANKSNNFAEYAKNFSDSVKNFPGPQHSNYVSKFPDPKQFPGQINYDPAKFPNSGQFSDPTKNYSVKNFSMVSDSVRVQNTIIANQVCSQVNQPMVEGIYDFGGANVKSCAFMKGNHPMATTVSEIPAQQMQV